MATGLSPITREHQNSLDKLESAVSRSERVIEETGRSEPLEALNRLACSKLAMCGRETDELRSKQRLLI